MSLVTISSACSPSVLERNVQRAGAQPGGRYHGTGRHRPQLLHPDHRWHRPQPAHLRHAIKLLNSLFVFLVYLYQEKVVNEKSLAMEPQGEGGSRSLRSWSWIHKVLELDP